MSRALGRYELLRPLARGGMAEVFLARRRAGGIEKLFVVKRIRPEREGDVRFLDLFVREARLSMGLAHQNIVHVFDFGRSGDQVFLALEHVEGRDLGSTLHRAGRERRLPPVLAAYIAAECCQALDYAHQRKRDDGTRLGVVHRDVTPRNVLVSWSGEVKLTDFGIAALAGDETTTLIGTPGYMAPEQARGERLDERADLYALGLVLREALTGERARVGVGRDALVEVARHGELSPWPPGFEGPLVAIIDRATAVRVDDRFADARSMLAELDAFIVGERATHRSEAPARLLATWLADVWGTDRDPLDTGPTEHAELVSFLDDGEIGTGTERSLVATAADESTPVARSEAPHEPAPEPAPSTRARSRHWKLVGLVTLAGAVIALALPRFAERLAAPTVALTADASSARRPETLTPRAEHTVSPTVLSAAPQPPTQPPAAVDPPMHAAATEAPPTRTPRAAPARPLSRSAATRAPTAREPGNVLTARPPLVLRKVRINARPWAVFTVDDQPTSYETIKTIELAPGMHRIRFSNPQLRVEREVTIEVATDRDLDYVEDLRR